MPYQLIEKECGEVVRFISFLGYGEVILENDQEPVILKLEKLVQRSWTRLGLKTVMENPPVHAHSSNAAVENFNIENLWFIQHPLTPRPRQKWLEVQSSTSYRGLELASSSLAFELLLLNSWYDTL